MFRCFLFAQPYPDIISELSEGYYYALSKRKNIGPFLAYPEHFKCHIPVIQIQDIKTRVFSESAFKVFQGHIEFSRNVWHTRGLLRLPQSLRPVKTLRALNLYSKLLRLFFGFFYGRSVSFFKKDIYIFNVLFKICHISLFTAYRLFLYGLSSIFRLFPLVNIP